MKYISQLSNVFRSVPDKHEAHRQCRKILEEMSGDDELLTELISRFVSRPGALNSDHYPIIGIPIEKNADFELVANCFLPLPTGQCHISSHSIHHHGSMLLSSVTAFGPGYEHWTFQRPEPLDLAQDRFRLDLIDRRPHPRHHTTFVDAHIAHCTMYPPALSITFALWTNSRPTGWKDRLKRLPIFRGREHRLRNVAIKLGLKKHLDLKVVEYFDFFPDGDGFVGMRERRPFGAGANVDFLFSLFHILQATGRESLASVIRGKLGEEPAPNDRAQVDTLLNDLDRGIPIASRISENQFNLNYANFTTSDIERALAGQPGRNGGSSGN